MAPKGVSPFGNNRLGRVPSSGGTNRVKVPSSNNSPLYASRNTLITNIHMLEHELRDIKGAYEKRLEQARVQLEQAMDQHNDAEVGQGILRKSMGELEKQMADLKEETEKEMRKLKGEKEREVMQMKEEKEKEIEELKGKKEREIDEIRNAIDELLDERDEAMKAKKAVEEERNELKNEREEARKERDELKSEREEARKERDAIRQEKNSVIGEKTDTLKKLTSVQQVLDDLQKRIDDVTAELEVEKEAHAQKRQECERLEEVVEKTEAALERSENKRIKVEENSEKVKSTNADTMEDLKLTCAQSIEQLDKYQSKCAFLEEDNLQLKRRIELEKYQAHNQITNLRRELDLAHHSLRRSIYPPYVGVGAAENFKRHFDEQDQTRKYSALSAPGTSPVAAQAVTSQNAVDPTKPLISQASPAYSSSIGQSSTGHPITSSYWEKYAPMSTETPQHASIPVQQTVFPNSHPTSGFTPKPPTGERPASNVRVRFNPAAPAVERELTFSKPAPSAATASDATLPAVSSVPPLDSTSSYLPPIEANIPSLAKSLDIKMLDDKV